MGSIKRAKHGVSEDLSDRIAALDGAGETELTMLEHSDNAADIIVAGATKVADWKAMSGDATIATTGALTIGAKKVTAAKTAIADGKIFIGGADGAAAEQSISGDATLANTGELTIGAKKVTAAKTAIADGKIFVGGADGAAAEQSINGDVAISSTGEATIQPDSVDTGKLKVVTRDVTIAAEAASGNVTNAEDINGVILGHYPKTSVDSAIESIALTAESGQITVTLNAAQAGETPATVSVVVLQAPAT